MVNPPLKEIIVNDDNDIIGSRAKLFLDLAKSFSARHGLHLTREMTPQQITLGTNHRYRGFQI